MSAQVGSPVSVLVARRPLLPGRRVESGDLAVRRVPARYAPAGSAPLPELVLGRRLAVAVPAGAPVGEHLLAAPPGEGTAVAARRARRPR